MYVDTEATDISALLFEFLQRAVLSKLARTLNANCRLDGSDHAA